MSAGPLAVAAHAVVAYAVLLALLRLSGKRTVGQGTPFDFVLALAIGDLAEDLLFGRKSAAAFTVAAGALATLHLLIAWAKVRSPALDRLVDGRAAVLIRDGVPVAAGLRSERLSAEDLEALLRLWGLPRERWGDVHAARLEDNGKPTVVVAAAERPAVCGDLDGNRLQTLG